MIKQKKGHIHNSFYVEITSFGMPFYYYYLFIGICQVRFFNVSISFLKKKQTFIFTFSLLSYIFSIVDSLIFKCKYKGEEKANHSIDYIIGIRLTNLLQNGAKKVQHYVFKLQNKNSHHIR